MNAARASGSKDASGRLSGHFPGRPFIDAYGNGGFRFADMSHHGSVIILPSGVHAWRPALFADLTAADFAPALNEADGIELLLIGCGDEARRLPEPLRTLLIGRRLRFETMDTGAAARTYNVLLGEQRLVCAALLQVD